jgi:AraC-like DNA-binding protein
MCQPLLDPHTLRRLCRARDLLAARAHEPVQLAEAARAACLSPFHFQRLFTRAFGESPHRFLTRRRIELAKRLLAVDHLSVTDVCFETGYSSLGSFSAKFHAMVGCPPSVYRRELRRVFGYHAPWRIAFVPACFLGRFLPAPQGPQEARSAHDPPRLG